MTKLNILRLVKIKVVLDYALCHEEIRGSAGILPVILNVGIG
jgi:hypothetical protein